ncbi:MAG TPA: choice-of-anchor tandem repeat GloVer-containing protein [Rhizomicrobium sp.]
MYSFAGGTDGANPHGGVIELNGTLYGTTWGSVYSLDLANNTETVLYNQPGGTSSGLTDVEGTLYGTTETGGNGDYGTVFSYNLAAATGTIVYRFCSKKLCKDGAQPIGGVIGVRGMLYGTTPMGGKYEDCGVGNKLGCGTVFALDPATGVERTRLSFSNNATYGEIPLSTLLDVKGTLYGTTEYGGSGSCDNGCGTVFSLKGNKETVLYSFQNNGTDGSYPVAGLINVKGILYGTTGGGGSYGICDSRKPGCGTVFSIDPATGAETVIHAFGNGTDGTLPLAAPVYVKGKLYGTTLGGGNTGCTGGCGTVFSIDLATGSETVEYAFCSLQNCVDGSGPISSPALIDVDGVLYGTTGNGGAGSCNGMGCGTVFAITPRR